MAYVAINRPRMDWSGEQEHLTGQTVHVEDGSPVDTGLLDANGVRLYRTKDRHPIGFAQWPPAAK